MMKEQIASVKSAALEEIISAQDMKQLESARVHILGKKGELTRLQQGIRDVPREEKPTVGALLNEVRVAVNAALDQRLAELQQTADERAVAGVDITLPGETLPSGGLHPISLVREEAVRSNLPLSK